jgi:hypothetical protein
LQAGYKPETKDQSEICRLGELSLDNQALPNGHNHQLETHTKAAPVNIDNNKPQQAKTVCLSLHLF